MQERPQDYINRMRDKGVGEESIKNALLKAGWQSGDVERFLAKDTGPQKKKANQAALKKKGLFLFFILALAAFVFAVFLDPSRSSFYERIFYGDTLAFILIQYGILLGAMAHFGKKYASKYRFSLALKVTSVLYLAVLFILDPFTTVTILRVYDFTDLFFSNLLASATAVVILNVGTLLIIWFLGKYFLKKILYIDTILAEKLSKKFALTFFAISIISAIVTRILFFSIF